MAAVEAVEGRERLVEVDRAASVASERRSPGETGTFRRYDPDRWWHETRW